MRSFSSDKRDVLKMKSSQADTSCFANGARPGYRAYKAKGKHTGFHPVPSHESSYRAQNLHLHHGFLHGCVCVVKCV